MPLLLGQAETRGQGQPLPAAALGCRAAQLAGSGCRTAAASRKHQRVLRGRAAAGSAGGDRGSGTGSSGSRSSGCCAAAGVEQQIHEAAAGAASIAAGGAGLLTLLLLLLLLNALILLQGRRRLGRVGRWAGDCGVVPAERLARGWHRVALLPPARVSRPKTTTRGAPNWP